MREHLGTCSDAYGGHTLIGNQNQGDLACWQREGINTQISDFFNVLLETMESNFLFLIFDLS